MALNHTCFSIMVFFIITKKATDNKGIHVANLNVNVCISVPSLLKNKMHMHSKNLTQKSKEIYTVHVHACTVNFRLQIISFHLL